MTYHGDPKRDHQFWIYPRHKSLINPQWDAYDPNHLCNNYTLIDGLSDVKRYRCNGHQSFAGGWSQPGSYGNVSTPPMTYHGDPNREHHFWIYPSHKSLINRQWDAHDPNHLCNSYTLIDGFSEVKKYRCNGHWSGGAGNFYPGMQGSVSTPPMTYHGDPNREHHFWIYPSHKSLINRQWDAHDPNHLCNNYILIDGFSEVKKYRCNGHPNVWPGSAGGLYPAYH